MAASVLADTDAPERAAAADVGPVAGVFDWRAHLAQHDDRLLSCPEGRRVLTRLDPVLFALLYFRHHLSSPETGGRISFCRFHLDLMRAGLQWVRQDIGPAEIREAWIAPRGSGKSTLLFGILPAWALAHGHRKFVAAFADSGHQAQQHLASLKREFDTNVLLRRDFPELCKPGRRPLGGARIADNTTLYVARSGATFQARGIDASTLGAKVGTQRPDLLLHDDVEPDASNYSSYRKEQRLATILTAVFGMNLNAVVEFAGTTTMPGSIMHDIVRQETGGEVPQWVLDENIRAHYYPAIVTDPATGEDASLWPARWPMTYLDEVRHTREFRLNMMNDPMAADGDYWTDSDFTYGMPASPLTGQLLSIDPAVTSKKRSDFTALAIVGHSKPGGQCVVRHARTYKVQPGEQLRAIVLRTLEAFPETVGVVVESNQGGDAWRAILHDLPVPLRTLHQHEPKEVRAARLLNHYQRRRVIHEHKLPAAEEQMVAFPKAVNDDLVDAIGAGVDVYLGRRKVASVSTSSYVA